MNKTHARIRFASFIHNSAARAINEYERLRLERHNLNIFSNDTKTNDFFKRNSAYISMQFLLSKRFNLDFNKRESKNNFFDFIDKECEF